MTTYTEHPIGGHAWGHTAPLFLDYPQTENVITVPIPGQLRQVGLWWPELAGVSGWCGPNHAIFAPWRQATLNHAPEGATASAYVPEDPSTAGNVPPEEAVHLPYYLGRACSVCKGARVPLIYGPGLMLLCHRETWQWGRAYDLNVPLIQRLARAMPRGSIWAVRVFQMELMHPPGPEFGAAVGTFTSIIRGANPGVLIHVHLSLPAGSEGEFLARRETILDVCDGTYMGPDPVRLQQETITSMRAVLDATS